jgi:transcriptional regulator with GAF, ATPase, and Fis domain
MRAHEKSAHGTPDAGPDCRGSGDGILVLHSGSLRCGIVGELLSNDRHVVQVVADPAEAQARARCGRYQVLLVQLEKEPPPDAPVLAAIRALKAGGLTVLACAENATKWPLRVRCLPLLAGASHLLDSARAGFGSELRELLAHILRARAERGHATRRTQETMTQLGVVGESPVIMEAFRAVIRVAAFSDLTTLLTGETGTGKELLAHAIHALDPKRRNGPFVVLNCAALTPSLAESELFGHRRGAFTGADRDRPGLIRAANGGVLLLDEIGELDLALQAKLLRVLQASRVLRVGDEQEVTVSVRVIAATNRDLKQMVERQQFRADLFHRLNVLSIHIPPLRERPADIAPLIRRFVAKHAHLRPGWRLTAGADFVEALCDARLPGNVRQLENLVCYALVNKETDTPLHLSDLPAEFWEQLSVRELPGAPPTDPTAPRPAGAEEPAPKGALTDTATPWAGLLEQHRGNLTLCLQACERGLLAAALEQARGNQSRTAHLLGISARSVYSKVRKHELNSRLH